MFVGVLHAFARTRRRPAWTPITRWITHPATTINALRTAHSCANHTRVQEGGLEGGHPSTASALIKKNVGASRYAKRKGVQAKAAEREAALLGQRSEAQVVGRSRKSTDPTHEDQEVLTNEEKGDAKGVEEVPQGSRKDAVGSAVQGEPTFGRGESRHAASETVLNGFMTQKDKAARKNALELLALNQGVSAVQVETKRLRREDAQRRQRRKAHLIRLQPYLEKNLRLVELEADEDRQAVELQQTWSDMRLAREGIMLKGLEGYWLQQGFQFSADDASTTLGQNSILKKTKNYSRAAASGGLTKTAVFNKTGKAKLGWTRIQKGDQVALRPDKVQKDGDSETNENHSMQEGAVIATVRSITEFELRLTFRDPPADLDLLDSPRWRVDIAYNDTIEARLRNAVEAVAHDVDATRRDGAELSGTYLVDVLQESGRRLRPPSEDQAPISEWIKRFRPDKPKPNLDHLTESQRKAVELMIGERISLIQGPPGTGKTSTIVAAIKLLKHHYEIPHPILLTSHTNVAVDNLAEGCKEVGLNVVRAGPAGRVREAIMDITLEGRMEQHPLKSRLDDIESIRAATIQALQIAQAGRKKAAERDVRASQIASEDTQDNMYGMTFSELNDPTSLSASSADPSTGDPTSMSYQSQHPPSSDSTSADPSTRDPTSMSHQAQHPPFSDSTSMSADASPSQGPEQKEQVSIPTLRKRLSRLRQQAFFLRRTMEVDIFAEADVVCCTALSVPLIRSIDFPLVFFDEATMATEPITLATIVKGCQQLSLIGDHKQLSPLIRSREAIKEQLGESLFERLMARGDLQTVMLDTQHRMHPSLSAFSGKEFYNDNLLNGERTKAMVPLASTFVPKRKVEGQTGYLTFVNHSGREHLAKSKSLVNQSEAELVVSVVADLLVQNEDLHGSEIAIVTPYAGQRELLARSLVDPASYLRRYFAKQLEKRGGVEAKGRIGELGKLEVETIDGFEGREKRVVVFSMVRNNASRYWGFLNEHKRWNVALTRARNGLWIIGSIVMMENLSAEATVEKKREDADVEDGVKDVRPTGRPDSEEHAGFITRFADHVRKHGYIVDAGTVAIPSRASANAAAAAAAAS